MAKYTANNKLGFQPLYREVYDRLGERIFKGEWRSGEMLPSEHALAAELGVSQGTVRKALNELEAEQLIKRRQGKGTFVTEHTNEGSIFRFFRLTHLDGTRLTPESKIESIKRRLAKREEKSALNLRGRESVIEIRRIRIVDSVPCATEIIILPYTLFPDLKKLGSLTESLYPVYQSQFGIHIIRAQEQLRAEVATAGVAKRLKIPVNTSLLRVDRIALTIDKKRVEWRSTLFHTDNLVYSIDVD